MAIPRPPLFKVEGALNGQNVIVSCITGDPSTSRITHQIDDAIFIALERVNLGDVAVGRELQTRNGIRHEILSDVVKTRKFAVLAD